MSPLLALLACAPAASLPDAADRAAYATALAAPDLSAGAAACRSIVDPRLRGDCIAGVMVHSAHRDPALCDELAPEGLWHDECWFTTADDPDADFETRWARCGHAGSFAPACYRHQRLRHADVLGRARAPLDQRLEAVEALLARAPGTHPDEHGEVWRGYWRAAWLAQGRVEPAQCAALSPARAAACRTATREVVLDRARQSVHDGGLSACEAMAQPARVTLLPGGATVGDDPQVAAWVREALRDRCPAWTEAEAHPRGR